MNLSFLSTCHDSWTTDGERLAFSQNRSRSHSTPSLPSHPKPLQKHPQPHHHDYHLHSSYEKAYPPRKRPLTTLRHLNSSKTWTPRKSCTDDVPDVVTSACLHAVFAFNAAARGGDCSVASGTDDDAPARRKEYRAFCGARGEATRALCNGMDTRSERTQYGKDVYWSKELEKLLKNVL